MPAAAGIVVAESVQADIPRWTVLFYEKAFGQRHPDWRDRKRAKLKIYQVKVLRMFN